MRILEKINSAKAPAFAFELMGSGSLREILETCESVAKLNPLFFNVTSHCQNPIEVCGAIQTHFRVPAVAHLLCKGYTAEQTDAAMEELHEYMIDNVLLLQGEPPETPRKFPDGSTFNEHASDLVKQVSYSAYNFCIGVAGYPEKHFSAPDMATDIANLKRKVDAGAHYIVTQMFFDNAFFFNFVERCRSAGITVPIIPGLRVLQTGAQVEAIPGRFHVQIPPALADGLLSNPETAGREWAKEQARELLRSGFPLLHFFLLNDKESVKEVVASLTTL